MTSSQYWEVGCSISSPDRVFVCAIFTENRLQLMKTLFPRLIWNCRQFLVYMILSSVHNNFSEVSGQFVRTNSRMSRHSHICSDMIILISNQILCSLLAIMYAVVSKHTSKDSGIFILFLVAI